MEESRGEGDGRRTKRKERMEMCIREERKEREKDTRGESERRLPGRKRR